MRQRSMALVWWFLLGVVVLAVLGVGLVLMPRLLSATTYVAPTPTPTQLPPPPTRPTEPTVTSPTPMPVAPFPTSALPSAPHFSLPGGYGDTVTLADQLAQGPVVVIFFPRVGG